MRSISNKGFIFIETIIVICVLTVALMSLYANYSKIIANTKELNTFDTTEYNYKTYFLKKQFVDSEKYTFNDNECHSLNLMVFSDYNSDTKMCFLRDVSSSDYIKTNQSILDAYIIDYLNTRDFTDENDDIFLVEYKKEDVINSTDEEKLYLTYISSLNY